MHDVTHAYSFGEPTPKECVLALKQHIMSFIREPFQHFHLAWNASSAARFERLFQSLPPHEIYYHLIIYWARNHLQNLYGDLILPRSAENQVHAAVWWKADVQKENKKVKMIKRLCGRTPVLVWPRRPTSMRLRWACMQAMREHAGQTGADKSVKPSKQKPQEMTSLSAKELNNLRKRLRSISVCISQTDGA